MTEAEFESFCKISKEILEEWFKKLIDDQGSS